jgi:toxin YhaV
MAPRYRLFFQFRTDAPKTIIYVWLNDLDSIRKDGDKHDVYAVFASMLNAGKVPGDFSALLAQCSPYDVQVEPTGTEEES